MIGTALLAGLALVNPAFRESRNIEIPRDSIVKIVVQDELNVKKNRRGDRFSALVQDDRDLPRGTRLIGRVVDIEPETDSRPAAMRLEFYRAEIGDDVVVPFRAVPVVLDDKVRRRADGRYEATKASGGTGKEVVTGALGGLVVGALVKKPFQGAFFGAIVGIIASEANRKKANDVVISRDASMGALLTEDFRTTLDERAYPPAQDWPEVSVNDRELRFSEEAKPYFAGRELMAPLASVANQLNLVIDDSNQGAIQFVQSQDAVLRIEQDSLDYRLNGKKGSFSRAVVRKQGVLYIPIEAISLLNVGTVRVNGTIVETRT